MNAALATAQKKARPTRVVVLDDDAVFRVFLNKTMTKLGVEVVGLCSTIESAKKRLAGGDVDAVTIDVVLRGESGLDFLAWCQTHHKSVTTVLVTAGSERAARTGVDGVMLGAAALLMKPDSKRIEEFERELRRVFVGTADQASPARATKPVNLASVGLRLRPDSRDDLLAIGSSTGGPPVLLQLLQSLPAAFDVPIVITQHMPALHIPHLASLLTQKSGRPVQVADDGEFLMRGCAYLAGFGKHLLVERRAEAFVLRHSEGPAEHFCRPAVDPMFRSIAAACDGGALGVVLTGMGSDGALGAQALRARMNPVLIQDEASSVVWGMPGAVAHAGAADAVVPMANMANAIVEWMGFRHSGGKAR